MTAVLTRPARTTRRVWLATRDAYLVLGVCRDDARKLLAAKGAHAHKLHDSRAGEWLIARDVARAARRGATWERQVAICGCLEPGWSPPPCRVGRKRREPL